MTTALVTPLTALTDDLDAAVRGAHPAGPGSTPSAKPWLRTSVIHDCSGRSSASATPRTTGSTSCTSPRRRVLAGGARVAARADDPDPRPPLVVRGRRPHRRGARDPLPPGGRAPRRRRRGRRGPGDRHRAAAARRHPPRHQHRARHDDLAARLRGRRPPVSGRASAGATTCLWSADDQRRAAIGGAAWCPVHPEAPRVIGVDDPPAERGERHRDHLEVRPGERDADDAHRQRDGR